MAEAWWVFPEKALLGVDAARFFVDDEEEEESQLSAEKKQKVGLEFRIMEGPQLNSVAQDGSLGSLATRIKRFPPDHKWYNYMKSLVDSHGFDVEDIPWDDLVDINLIFPSIPVSPSLDDRAKVAIDIFNKRNGTRYQFVKVEKGNCRSWGPGINYYLTIQAGTPQCSGGGGGDDADHGLTTFQALVWEGPALTILVKFCRPKGQNS